jgi:hypothetical protein
MSNVLRHRVNRRAAAALILLSAAGPALATFADFPPLGLEKGVPDLQVNNVELTFTYNSGSDSVLSYSGSFAPGGYFDGSGTTDYFVDFSSTINLDVTTGTLDTGLDNFLTITDSTTSDVLLDGTIFSFGVTDLGGDEGTFEAELTVDATSLGFGIGETLVFIYNAKGIDDADWFDADSDFTSSALTSTLDVARAAPAPATLALVGFGLMLMAGRRHLPFPRRAG